MIFCKNTEPTIQLHSLKQFVKNPKISTLWDGTKPTAADKQVFKGVSHLVFSLSNVCIFMVNYHEAITREFPHLLI